MGEVGAQIRRLRKAKDWTVAQLAVYADMSPSAVSQIETGRRSPTAASMSKLAEALEVEVRDLFPLGQAPLPDLEDEQRDSRLSEVADDFLTFGHHLLQAWEAEMPDRARADDNEWLGNIAATWLIFGRINHDLLNEIVVGGLDDKQEWLKRYMARYMDVNTTLHRLNNAIQENIDAEPGEEILFGLEPLVVR